MGSCCSLNAKSKDQGKNINKDGKSFNEGIVKKESLNGKSEREDVAHPMSNYVFPRKSTENANQ